MPRRFHNIVLYMLVAVMAVAPLPGLAASMDMAPVQHMAPSRHAMAMQQQVMSMDSEHCMEKCKNCQQHSCNGHHQCQHAQCFSSSAFMPAVFDFNVEQMTQAQPAQHIEAALAASPSPLFRPPRV